MGGKSAGSAGLQLELDQFAGHDYIPEVDDERLSDQFHRIFDLMRDKQWRTLSEIQKATVTDEKPNGDPGPSVSAQLRHMRKQRFGSHTVERRRVEGREAEGLFEYKLIVNEKHLRRIEQ
jgi:hypothetical protein